MRRFQCALLAAVAAIGFGSLASAADMPVKARAAPIAAPNYDWSGFYFGANAGGAWGSNSVAYTPNDPLSAFLFVSAGAPPDASFRTSGVIGGLQLGYNWQLSPNWLLGAEADIDWSGVRGSATTGGIVTAIPFANTAEEKIKWFGTVRARLGYLPAPNLLAFVTGGLAYGQVEHTGTYTTSAPFGGSGPGGISFECSPAGAPCFAGSSSTVAGGWTLGGGLEYALSRNWTLRGEYLYISLRGNSVTETAPTPFPGDTPSAFTASFGRTNLNIARAAINYRF